MQKDYIIKIHVEMAPASLWHFDILTKKSIFQIIRANNTFISDDTQSESHRVSMQGPWILQLYKQIYTFYFIFPCHKFNTI